MHAIVSGALGYQFPEADLIFVLKKTVLINDSFIYATIVAKYP